MISLSSHVLDTTRGKPASNMRLQLTSPSGEKTESVTDADGRCRDWGGMNLQAGIYCLRFETKEYLMEHHKESFYPFVDIHFEMQEKGGHYHVPLLISPFGFSSYRGS